MILVISPVLYNEINTYRHQLFWKFLFLTVNIYYLFLHCKHK